MCRKISLCAALLGNPSILLLDEATNGLDPERSFRFKQYLQEFCKKGGTVLFSSHIIETIEYLCDQIIIIHEGKIRRELFRKEWDELRQHNSSLEQLFIETIHYQEKKTTE